jgi:hypothetical protein
MQVATLALGGGMPRLTYDRPAGSAEVEVRGAIVDSWVEPAGSCGWDSRLVVQVAPRGKPRELLTLEADARLVPDLGWLADLGENLCHGNPISVVGHPTRPGIFRATRLDLQF